MPLLADAFQPFLVRSLSKVRRPRNVGSLADLVIGQNAGYELSILNQVEAVLLDFRDGVPIAEAIAGDCSRFSCAAFQSVADIGTELSNRDTVAWGLLKLYYAAFYAGHATLRVLGESCTYFNRPHINRLNSLADALGITAGFKMEAGLYHCILLQSDTVISCTKARGSVGGAHEAFWDVYGKKMKSVGDDILRGGLPRADAQFVYSQIDQILVILSRMRAYSWLSFIRNDIQYRLLHGVWYPEIMKSQSRETLRRMAIQWVKDPMRIDLQPSRLGHLGDFTNCCSFIVSLCREILMRIGERSDVGAQSFVRAGPLSFLNDIEAAA